MPPDPKRHFLKGRTIKWRADTQSRNPHQNPKQWKSPKPTRLDLALNQIQRLKANQRKWRISFLKKRFQNHPRNWLRLKSRTRLNRKAIRSARKQQSYLKKPIINPLRIRKAWLRTGQTALMASMSARMLTSGPL